MTKRRRVLGVLIAALTASMALPASAQNFPTKPITIVVPQAAGAPNDLMARIMAPEMAKILGQPVVVDNRPGADNLLGFEYVAKAPPDGHTVVIATMANQALFPLQVKDLRFDPIKDLPPVVGVAAQRLFVTTAAKQTFKTLAEVTAYARANPGKLHYGATSILTGTILVGLAKNQKWDGLYVPYSSTATRDQALLSGEIHLGMLATPQVIGYADQVRPLAVSGTGRHPRFPDVPTLAELNLGEFITSSTFSLNVPAGTPKAAMDKLYAAASQTLKMPEVAAQFEKIGVEVSNESPEQVANTLANQVKTVTALVNMVGPLPTN